MLTDQRLSQNIKGLDAPESKGSSFVSLWLLLLTQHVQSGLRFLLSDHSQAAPVSLERRHLSIQEGVLGGGSLENSKATTLAEAKRPFTVGRTAQECVHLPAEQVSGWFQ